MLYKLDWLNLKQWLGDQINRTFDRDLHHKLFWKFFEFKFTSEQESFISNKQIFMPFLDQLHLFYDSNIGKPLSILHLHFELTIKILTSNNSKSSKIMREVMSKLKGEKSMINVWILKNILRALQIDLILFPRHKFEVQAHLILEFHTWEIYTLYIDKEQFLKPMECLKHTLSTNENRYDFTSRNWFFILRMKCENCDDKLSC